jgi:hypothetical protein
MSLLKKECIDINNYDALVMDTQGSELLVLKGAASLLPKLKFIKTEVCDFESHAGCCQLRDLEQFLKQYGFREFARQPFATRAEGGTYYDVIYKRSSFWGFTAR